MFSMLIKQLPCSSCENGKLHYNQKLTFEAWQQPEIFRLDDIDKLKDGIVSDVLVFVCNQCDAVERFTLKEVIKKSMKNLSDRLLTMIARGDVPDPGSFRNVDRTYIYCGKCNGYDGKGACPRKVYEDCKLKRLPYGF